MAEHKITQKNQSVIRSAGAMSVGTLSSRILGLLRDVVLTAFFSRTVTDAFYVAFSFPNKFRRLLGEGSLSVSFIPVYLEKKQLDPEQAKALSSSLFALLMLVTGLICALGVIFMEPLMELLVSGDGYQSIQGKLDTTVSMARIMFSYLFLVSNYAFFMALLNAHKQFFIPALAPALFNLVFIFFAIMPQKWGSFSGQLLAFGVLAGGLLQMVMVMLPLWRQKLLPSLHFNWSTSGLQLVLRNMIPGVLGMGILQFLTLVNLNYASRLQEGAHSYIYLADRILELPQSLIAISLGAALLPTLSEFWSSGNKEKMIEVGQAHMKVLLFLSLPSAVGMFVLAQPIVEVLFMRRMFTADDAMATATVVQIYSFLLVAASLTKVTIPNFYAIKNTWLPALTSIAAISVHIVLGHFMVDAYGLTGLVFSMAVSGFVNLFLILFFYKRMIGPLNLLPLGAWAVKLIPGLAAMGLLVHYLYGLLLSVLNFAPEYLARPISLFITIASGIVLYFFVAQILAVPQAQKVIAKFLPRRGK